jgi:hypothetical protein
MKRIIFLSAVSLSVLAFAETHGYRQVDQVIGAPVTSDLPVGDENLLSGMIASTDLSVDGEDMQFDDTTSKL